MKKEVLAILNKVKKQILAHPETYNQFNNSILSSSKCGCIGWHINKIINNPWNYADNTIRHTTNCSTKLAHSLSYVKGIPWENNKIRNYPTGTLPHAKEGVKAINKFIKEYRKEEKEKLAIS